MVTINAMGAQDAIAETIVRGGGDHLLALKGNGPAPDLDAANGHCKERTVRSMFLALTFY